MVSLFAAITNKEIESHIIKQTVPEIYKEGDENRFGSFNGQTMVCLTWIYQWKWLKIFCSQMKIKTCINIYLADMFINMIKTKFNNITE